MKKCVHLWMLNHKVYFNVQNSLIKWKDEGGEESSGVRVFPAKCYICREQKKFTKEAWLEHIKDQM